MIGVSQQLACRFFKSAKDIRVLQIDSQFQLNWNQGLKLNEIAIANWQKYVCICDKKHLLNCLITRINICQTFNALHVLF